MSLPRAHDDRGERPRATHRGMQPSCRNRAPLAPATANSRMEHDFGRTIFVRTIAFGESDAMKRGDVCRRCDQTITANRRIHPTGLVTISRGDCIPLVAAAIFTNVIAGSRDPHRCSLLRDRETVPGLWFTFRPYPRRLMFHSAENVDRPTPLRHRRDVVAHFMATENGSPHLDGKTNRRTRSDSIC